MNALVDQIGRHFLWTSGLALAVLLVTWLVRHPRIRHCLWLLVLLRFLVPPVWAIPIRWPHSAIRRNDVAAAPSVDLQNSAVAARIERTPIAAKEPPTKDPPTVFSETLETKPLLENAAFQPLALPKGALPEEPPPEQTQTATAPRHSRIDVRLTLLASWFVGAACLVYVTISRILCFHRLLWAGSAPAAEELQQLVHGVAQRMHIRRVPTVCVTRALVSPMLWPLGRRPLLVLPEKLFQQLSVEQQRLIVAHELAHLGRRDHWVRFLECLATWIHWWNPVVWLVRRELRDAEEQCCDREVLRFFPESGAHYGRALLGVAELLADPPKNTAILASSIGNGASLKRRVEMIVTHKSRPAGSRMFSTLGVAAVLILAPLTTRAVTDEPQEKSNPAALPVPAPGATETENKVQLGTTNGQIKVDWTFTSSDAATQSSELTIANPNEVKALLDAILKSTKREVRIEAVPPDKLKVAGSQADIKFVQSTISHLNAAVSASPAEQTLETIVTFDFQETPLTDVIEFFRGETSTNIILDLDSLDIESITPDCPVTMSLKNVTLRLGFKSILSHLGLLAVPEENVIWIVNAERGKELVKDSEPTPPVSRPVAIPAMTDSSSSSAFRVNPFEIGLQYQQARSEFTTTEAELAELKLLVSQRAASESELNLVQRKFEANRAKMNFIQVMLESAKESASLEVELAQNQVDQYKELQQKGATPQSIVRQAELQLRQAKAYLDALISVQGTMR